MKINLTEILSLQPDEFREAAKKILSSGGNLYLTSGAILNRIKREDLWQKWGYKNYLTCAREEFGVPVPTPANYWLTCTRRLIALGYSVSDLETLERMVPPKLMSSSTYLADSKEEIETLWEKVSYKQTTLHVLMHLKKPTKTKWPRGIFHFNKREFILVETAIEYILKKYLKPDRHKERAIAVMAIAYLTFVEYGPQNMTEHFKTELARLSLPDSIADWQKIEPLTEDGRKIQGIAKELSESRKLAEKKKPAEPLDPYGLSRG